MTASSILSFAGDVIRRVRLYGIPVLAISGALRAQTLTLDNEVQTHATLTSTTVTVTGSSELRITAAVNPIPGSTIQLAGPDAWLRFTAIKPSAVNASLLGQLRIDGAAAVPNTNCRLAQYGDGAVVIPHGATFRPLEVFDGPSFTGESSALLPHVAYSDANFGLANRVTSLRLKRGYTVTLAQNANGSGVSRNYVAQDGDLQVPLLPSDLDDTVSFIRVFPWRWTTKKGIGGNIESGLQTGWGYNWNIDRNSSLDWEYVPIRQSRWWPNLGQNWQSRGACHLLGYNEPDSADQANITVGDALWSWPDLLGTGLRVGSPAPTDGGLNWLYSFVDGADAANLRVDFVAVHYYRCFNPSDPQGAANQMYNFLKGVHDRTGRPVWVTEWNNGANWTGCGDPSFAQQSAAVNAMMDMMEAAPFVERYALYNWVEDVRRLKWDDGSLTGAGGVYRDKPSGLSHQQLLPESATTPAAFYRFENHPGDSGAGGHGAMLRGAAGYAAGKSGRGLTLSGNLSGGDHVMLPPRLGDSADFTFGAWVYWNGGANWQRIVDLGADTSRYLFLTPSADNGRLRFAIRNGGAEQQLNHASALPVKTWTHVAVTMSGNTGKLFVNGSLVATHSSMTLNPADLGTTVNYLGKSRFANDPLFAGILDEVQFFGHALSDSQVLAMQSNAPPRFAGPLLNGGTATQGAPFTGTLAGAATDAGDTLTYAKLAGPVWLSVAPNGALSGTPGPDDEGVEAFVITATDSTGATAITSWNLTLPVSVGSGTWTADSDGNWGDVGKWRGGFRANGPASVADFSTLDITSHRVVDLDIARTLGGMRFGDTAGGQNWILREGAGGRITLEAAAPSIAVNQNSATLAIALEGASGLTKTGAGTLVLAGANSLSGTFFIDSASNSSAEGVVRLAHPDAAAGFTALQIRNNNSGYSTLELDASVGPVTVACPLSLSGRNNTVPAIRNRSGRNTLAGTISIQSGGSNYRIESQAGTLELGGSSEQAAGVAFTSTATGSRTLTLQGGGDGVVGGRIQNGGADTVHVIKSGTGTWTLAGANSYTGTTAITQGALVLAGATGSGTTTVANGAMLAGTGAVSGMLAAQNGSTVRMGAAGFPMVQPVTAIDDFESYTPGATTTATGGVWNGEFVGTGNSNVVASGGGLALQTKGGAAWRGGKTDLTRWKAGIGLGQTGTVFFQMKAVGSGSYDIMTGLAPSPANIDTVNAWQDFSVMPWVNGSAGSTLAFKMTDAGLPGDVIFPMATDVWYNVWLVVDNRSGSYAVYWSTGTDDGLFGGKATMFRNGFAPGPLSALGFMAAGQAGTSLLVDNILRLEGVDTAYPIGVHRGLVPSAGVMNVAGDFTLDAGATLEFDIAAGPIHDKLMVGGSFQAAGALKVSLDPALGAPGAGDRFDLFDAAGGNVGFSKVDLPVLPPGLSWDSTRIGQGMLSITGVQDAYAVWAGAWSWPIGQDAPTADANRNGMANVFEWLFGGDPVGAAGSSPAWPVLALKSTGGVSGTDPDKPYLSLVATVRKNTPGWILVAEAAASPELLGAPGSTDGIVSRPLEDFGEFERREWIRTLPPGDAPAGFMRLKLKRP